jgi:flagellar motor component MotA
MTPFILAFKSQRSLVVNLVIAIIGVLTAVNLVPVGFVLTPEQVAEHFDVIAGAIAVVGAVANFLLNLKPRKV